MAKGAREDPDFVPDKVIFQIHRSKGIITGRFMLGSDFELLEKYYKQEYPDLGIYDKDHFIASNFNKGENAHTLFKSFYLTDYNETSDWLVKNCFRLLDDFRKYLGDLLFNMPDVKLFYFNECRFNFPKLSTEALHGKTVQIYVPKSLEDAFSPKSSRTDVLLQFNDYVLKNQISFTGENDMLLNNISFLYIHAMDSDTQMNMYSLWPVEFLPNVSNISGFDAETSKAELKLTTPFESSRSGSYHIGYMTDEMTENIENAFAAHPEYAGCWRFPKPHELYPSEPSPVKPNVKLVMSTGELDFISAENNDMFLQLQIKGLI